MGQKDLSEKILEDYQDVFADILNVLLFQGRQIVKPEELMTQSFALTTEPMTPPFTNRNVTLQSFGKKAALFLLSADWKIKPPLILISPSGSSDMTEPHTANNFSIKIIKNVIRL